MEEKCQKPASRSTDEQQKKNVRPARINLPRPKRGAFPTPKAEIESAKPYIPEGDQAGDNP
jgi:hypothetical protein